MNPDTETSLAAPIDLQAELTEAQKAQREITLMIEQSQNEVTKLAQRNASINAHLQQVQTKIEQVPAAEVRMAYDAALDAQQRLFVMRGQLDKLQSDKDHLEKYCSALERLGQAQGEAGRWDRLPSPKDPWLRSRWSSTRRKQNDSVSPARCTTVQPRQWPTSSCRLRSPCACMDVDPKKAKEELVSLKGSALGTFQKLRNFIFELRPMMLDDLGLAPTIRKYVEAFKEQTTLEATLTVTGTERRLEPYLEVMIFRAVQELLGNAARHSQAAEVKMQVDMGNDAIRVSVDDNGRGFDPECSPKHSTLGLRLIRGTR